MVQLLSAGRRAYTVWVIGAFSSALAACGSQAFDAAATAEVGSPLPGLEVAEVARFEIGRVAFGRQFTPHDGLGPRFNENACDACHTDPAVGGTGETLVTKATRYGADGRCDLLVHLGGENVRLRVTPEAGAGGATRPPVPPEATETVRLTIPFLYGLGLVDAVEQSEIERRADPDDRDEDGISGRVGIDAHGHPARFGRKADTATLEDFVVGAFRLEMGVTSPAAPEEAEAGGVPEVPEGTDLAPDPEIDQATVDAVTDFVRFLAPPGRAEPPDDDDVAAAARGRELFQRLGCASCHVRALVTGPSAVRALAHKRFVLYSDLLLHDMGPGLAGTCGPGASPTEYRTEPLLGLRYRKLFLHDGRVGRVIDAILAHGGEAARARAAFAALHRVTQEDLIRFLDTL